MTQVSSVNVRYLSPAASHMRTIYKQVQITRDKFITLQFCTCSH